MASQPQNLAGMASISSSQSHPGGFTSLSNGTHVAPSTNPFPAPPFIIPPPAISSTAITTAMITSLANDTSFQPLSLDLDNYAYWSRKILDVFELNEMDRYIKGTIKPPEVQGPTADVASYWN